MLLPAKPTMCHSARTFRVMFVWLKIAEGKERKHSSIIALSHPFDSDYFLVRLVPALLPPPLLLKPPAPPAPQVLPFAGGFFRSFSCVMCQLAAILAPVAGRSTWSSGSSNTLPRSSRLSIR